LNRSDYGFPARNNHPANKDSALFHGLRGEKVARFRGSTATAQEKHYNSIKCLSYNNAMERAFDHEKLDVYQIELQFIAWLTDFFLEVSQSRAARCGELFEQLDRASLSALLNTAEGNGKRQGRQRAKFFDDARG